MQESENGLCNNPPPNGRQARASRAICTCQEVNVLFTSRHTQVLHQLHVEMGLLSSRSAQLTLEHHAGFNKTEEEHLFCGSFHTFQNQTAFWSV